MSPTSTHDQLAFARAAAAERQRRADEFRTRRDVRPARRRVPMPALAATIATAALGFGLGALTTTEPAVADVVDPPRGAVEYDTYTEMGTKQVPGLVDGWYEIGTSRPAWAGPTSEYR